MKSGDIVERTSRPGHFGTITKVHKDGQHRVKWDNGDEYDHHEDELVKIHPSRVTQHQEVLNVRVNPTQFTEEQAEEIVSRGPAGYTIGKPTQPTPILPTPPPPPPRKGAA